MKIQAGVLKVSGMNTSALVRLGVIELHFKDALTLKYGMKIFAHANVSKLKLAILQKFGTQSFAFVEKDQNAINKH